MNHDELVEKMCQAYLGEAEKNGFCVEQHNHIRQQRSRGMAAALRVCVEEVLQPPTAEDMAITWNACARWPLDRTDWPYLVKNLIASRAMHYLPQPTLEERTTIKQVKIGVPPTFWHVFFDGVDRGVQFLEEEDAETFRLGLIEKIRKAGKS